MKSSKTIGRGLVSLGNIGSTVLAGTLRIAATARRGGKTIGVSIYDTVVIGIGHGSAMTQELEAKIKEVRLGVGKRTLISGNSQINGFLWRAILRGNKAKDTTLCPALNIASATTQTLRDSGKLPVSFRAGEQVWIEIDFTGSNTGGTTVITSDVVEGRISLHESGEFPGDTTISVDVKSAVVAASQLSYDYMDLSPTKGSNPHAFFTAAYLGATEGVSRIDMQVASSPCSDMDRAEAEAETDVPYAVGYVSLRHEPYPVDNNDKIGYQTNATATASAPRVARFCYDGKMTPAKA